MAKTKEPTLAIGMVQLLGCRCRCGHEWLPRGNENPTVCPKCKSPRWDKPKQFERKGADE
jgi:predicted Zn-ribbon and HTH transcriptional regulator